MKNIIKKTFNPHWINDEHTRDYQIGNIIIRDVPDKFVVRNAKFGLTYPHAELTEGNIQEFLNNCKIKVVLKIK